MHFQYHCQLSVVLGILNFQCFRDTYYIIPNHYKHIYSSDFNNMHFYNYCTTEVDIEIRCVHVFIQQYILRHQVQTN